MAGTNGRDNQYDIAGSSLQDPRGLVVGIAFRIPRASNFKELSSLLRTKETTKTTRVDQFGTIDADFFKVTPKEACQSSPLLGSLLEVVAECIMESGIPLRDVASRRTGLYLQSNMPDTYMELTCNVAHYYNFKGPVIDYGGLDASPINAIHTALLDMETGRCELAVIVGVCKQGHFQPTSDRRIIGDGHRACTQEYATEGVVGMLIMAPNLKSKLMSRVHCEIFSVGQLYIPVKNNDDKRMTETPITETVGQGPKESDNGRLENSSKTSYPDIVDEMFKGAESISALMSIIIAICSSKRFDKGTGRTKSKLHEHKLEDELECTKDNFVNVVIQQKHEIVLRMTTVLQHENKEEYNAALVPTTVHPNVAIGDAETSLNLYENERGFLSYLINSDMCKGSKRQLQQLYYYFKTPEGSYFSKQDYTSYGELPVTVVFDDFLLMPWKPSSDILNIPVIKGSISAFDEILRNDAGSSISVYNNMSSSNIPDTTEQGGITTRVACQMAMVDLLKAVNSLDHIQQIKASGLGSIAASYADCALTRLQAVQVALVLEDAVLKATKRHGEKCIFDVACPVDDVYQLGPWVQILCHLPRIGFRIAAPWDRRNRLIIHILGKGFEYKEHCIRVPLFNAEFKRYLDDGLEKCLSRILPTRALWSSRIVILGFHDKGTKPMECSSSFFKDLLHTPFDDEPQKMNAFGLLTGNCPLVPGIETSVSPSNFEDFEILIPSYNALKEKSENDIPHDTSRSEKKCQSEPRRVNSSNALQEIQDGVSQISITKRENVLLTPGRDLDSVNCSTNAIRGSFLCSQSIPTESVSSMSELRSELQSEDLSSEYLKSETSESPSSDTMLMERQIAEENERITDVNVTLQLHLFVSESVPHFTSKDVLEDSSIRTNVSSGNTLVQTDVHVHINPKQTSLLEALAWIHGTGNPMEAEKQLCHSTMPAIRYQGDFGLHNLWAWNRQPCCRIHSALNPNFDTKEDVRMYRLSQKPRLSEAVLQNLIANRNLEQQAQSGTSHCSEKRKTYVCPFDSSLLLLSGYQWDAYSNRIIPIHSPDSLSEDLKIQKQVRFSYRSKRCLDANLAVDNAVEEIEDLMDDENKAELADDLQFGFADRGDLSAVLNCIKAEDFNFVSLLQIDESMERYLMDMLYTFPLTSALHVFITPKLRATSTSKYVINISRKISTFGDEVVVVLRDRSTDQAENCSSVANALSIISSFEDKIIYDNTLARVFELRMFLDDGSFSVGRLEAMIFENEIDVSREMYSDLDPKTGVEYLSSSTSSSSYDLEDFVNAFQEDVDCNGNFESKCDTEEHFEKASSSQERPSRERNSSPNVMTSFYLNFESSSVEALMKLSKINDHTLACVKPKPITESMLVEDDLDLCDEVRESDAAPSSQQDEVMYMISLKSEPESQVFLYCKKPHEVSRWENIKDVVDELKRRHPALPVTHEAFVSKCDEKLMPFEELLYEFLYDSRNIENEKNKMDVRGLPVESSKADINLKQPHEDGNNNPRDAEDDGDRQGMEMLKTPCMFAKGIVIPEIVISPPEPCTKTTKSVERPSCLTQVCCDGEVEIKEDFIFEPSLGCIDKTSRENVTVGPEDPVEVEGILENETLKPPKAAHDEELTRPCVVADTLSLESSEGTRQQMRPTHTDQEWTASEQIGSSPLRPENDSFKENSPFYAEPEVFDDFEHLKKPNHEELKHMTNFRVSAALVIHLIDKTSSFHEQRGRAAGNVLLYVARESVTADDGQGRAFLGMVVFDDLDVRHSRFSIPSSFEDKHLETTLNYLLGWYILRVLARISRDKAPRTKILVQPPIQRDSASIMLVANHLDCERIVTQSSLEDHRDDIQRMIPGCVVLEQEIDRMAVLPVVGKEGVNVAIMLRQQELTDMLDLVAPSGCLVLCGDVDRTFEIGVNSIANNGQITFFDALSAARYLTTMADKEKEEFQQDLQNILLNQDSQMDDCYPPSREGYFYQVLGRISSSKPEEQPAESSVHEMFFSTTRSLLSVFGSVTQLEWTFLGRIFERMAKCSGDDCFPGNG